MTPQRILIVEPNHTGHRYYPVRLVVEHALRNRQEVFILTTAQGIYSDEFRVHLGQIASHNSRVHLLPQFAKLVPGGWTEAMVVSGVAQAVNADRIIATEGDRLVLPWLVLSVIRRIGLRPIPVLSAVIMRSPGLNAATRLSAVRAKTKTVVLSIAAALNFAKLFILSNQGVDVPVPKLLRAALNGGIIRDPAPVLNTSGLKENLRDRLDLPPSLPLVGLMGLIGTRKSPGLIIEAVSKARREIPNVTLVIAGKVDSDCASVIQNGLSAGVVILRDGYHDEETFNEYLASLDCLVLPSTNDLPSGLVERAAQAKIPVLAVGSRYLRRIVAERAMGVGSSLDASEIAIALVRILTSKEPFVSTQSAGAYVPGLEQAFADALLQ